MLNWVKKGIVFVSLGLVGYHLNTEFRELSNIQNWVTVASYIVWFAMTAIWLAAAVAKHGCEKLLFNLSSIAIPVCIGFIVTTFFLLNAGIKCIFANGICVFSIAIVIGIWKRKDNKIQSEKE